MLQGIGGLAAAMQQRMSAGGGGPAGLAGTLQVPGISPEQIGQQAGAAANTQLGAPPPMPQQRRKFPNPMQAQQLMSLMGGMA